MAASTLQLPQATFVWLLDGLCGRFPRVDRQQWAQRMTSGRVLDASGHPLGIDTPYRVGQVIHYFREVEVEPRIPFEATIVHADPHLVVVDKPHFLPVAPTGIYVHETLLTRLVHKLDNPDLVPLHRIDRGTAGLVLFSANRATRGVYQALFRQRRIDKDYEALAPPIRGVTWPLLRQSCLVRGQPFFRMQEVDGPVNATSWIERIEPGEGRVGDRDEAKELWRYRLRPVTGRKHQLRVHMAALGAAILNDRVYPMLLPKRPDDYAQPMQLLARTLQFEDPLSGLQRHFTSGRCLSMP